VDIILHSTPVTNPTPNPTTTPVTRPTPNPTTTPVTQPTPNPTTTPVTQPTPNPTTTPVTQPTPNPTTAPVTQQTLLPTTVDSCSNTGQILVGDVHKSWELFGQLVSSLGLLDSGCVLLNVRAPENL